MSLSYEDALELILSASSPGMRPGLARTQALLDGLGNPERALRGVLVAGSNGKGSVCAALDSICRAAGLRTVTLVKPHLITYRERVLIDGVSIAEDRFAELVARVVAAGALLPEQVGGPTQFELLTALGILAAAEERPDLVICEVGLGGRLDSTNVLDLGVAVVTSVSLEHRAELGDTVEQIAAEKAAIIKPGNHVVTGARGPALEVVRRFAAAVGAAGVAAVGAELIADGITRGRAGVALALRGAGAELAVHAPLIGGHQIDNLAVAIGAALALRDRGCPIDDAAIRRGCAQVHWAGRLQWVDGEPPLLLDAAHNPAAVDAIAPAVRELADGRNLVLLFGAMQDKEVDPMLRTLRGLTGTAVFTQPGSVRSRSAIDLAHRWGAGARGLSSLPDALATARLLAGANGLVLACGSIYLVGDVLRLV
ncbi:MAG: folylpolyglutamate synthase/dihydrofolate synthase family protein [Candidatus Dormibacteria bacterium]